MKRERSVIESRRKRILEMMEDRPEVRVDELSEILGVSPITVRRDLQYLEDNKQLVRFYGGAAPSFAVGEAEFKDEVQMYRALIARYAAELPNTCSFFWPRSRPFGDIGRQRARRGLWM